MVPNIKDFDIYHAGVSGGKDSTALALWLRFESGLPLEQIDMTFCDTENEDPFTYAFLDLLRSVIAPAKITVIRPERNFWELAHHKKRFPSTKARFCTQYLKIIPTRAYVQELLEEHNVLVLNGVRRSEGHSSNDRAHAARWEYDWDGWGCWLYRPIVDWTIEQVWDIHRKYLFLDDVLHVVWDDPTMEDEMKAHLTGKIMQSGIPRNPLYDMGASRVGCFPCINSNKREVRSMAKYRPERIDFIEMQELSFTDTRNGISTFFSKNNVPMHLRSREIETKSGEHVKVATIRDIVDWSQTARGGRQYDMDFDLPASSCDIGGMCE